jgi:hypothetical protein
MRKYVCDSCGAIGSKKHGDVALDSPRVKQGYTSDGKYDHYYADICEKCFPAVLKALKAAVKDLRKYKGAF